MGCVNDKDSNNPIEPSIMAGSTMLRADQMVVIGDSVFLKTMDENGEYKVVAVSIDDKKITCNKGLTNRLTREVLS